MHSPAQTRGQVVRAAIGIGAAVGAYGLSFGALATASGFTWLQAQALSLLLYSGAAQFAFIGTAAAGGPLASAALAASFLGLRNLFYGVRLGPLLRLRGPRRALAAQFVTDESTALALAHPDRPRFAFWSAGLAVFTCWNLGTLVGALAGAVLPDPKQLGLDAASSAALLALIASRLRNRVGATSLVLAATIAVLGTTVLPAGMPVLLAGAAALCGLTTLRGRTAEHRRQAPPTRTPEHGQQAPPTRTAGAAGTRPPLPAAAGADAPARKEREVGA